MTNKKIKLFYWLVWRHFDYPLATDAGRERVSVDTDSGFHQLIWEMIARDYGKNKGRLSRGRLFWLKTEEIERVVTHW